MSCAVWYIPPGVVQSRVAMCLVGRLPVPNSGYWRVAIRFVVMATVDSSGKWALCYFGRHD